jgi:cellulose synthase (UDP-forming)
MKPKFLFVIIFLSIYLFLNLIIAYYLNAPSLKILIHFIIIQTINIGVAYNLTELILTILLERRDLPKVDRLTKYPPVAILYVTFNDVIYELLENLKCQTYPNYDIYVLDDSTDEKCKEIIDDSNLNIIRRDNRRGFKAGALNNWLSIKGNNYEYFSICDSDSYIKEDFLEKMVKYAEHDQNNNIAIFQSRIWNWNKNNPFPRNMGSMLPFFDYINCRLINSCEYVVSWGHNNLLRTGSILSVGGFNEEFIAEDLVVGINLLSHGYKCKLVDIISYEMIPENIQSYSIRQARWARQNLELFKLDLKDIDFVTRLHIFMLTYNFFIWYFYFIGIIIVIFGYNSNLNIVNISYYSSNFSHITSGPFFIYIFYILNFSVFRLPLALKLGVSISQYAKNLLLITAISYMSMFDTIREQTKYLIGYKSSFIVTNKAFKNESLFDIIKNFKAANIFIIIILAGLTKNPFALILNFIWLIPFIFSSIIIYITQKKATNDGFISIICKKYNKR